MNKKKVIKILLIALACFVLYVLIMLLAMFSEMNKKETLRTKYIATQMFMIQFAEMVSSYSQECKKIPKSSKEAKLFILARRGSDFCSTEAYNKSLQDFELEKDLFTTLYGGFFDFRVDGNKLTISTIISEMNFTPSIEVHFIDVENNKVNIKKNLVNKKRP